MKSQLEEDLLRFAGTDNELVDKLSSEELLYLEEDKAMYFCRSARRLTCDNLAMVHGLYRRLRVRFGYEKAGE